MKSIVYGSPCSGKTTYVRQHAGADDLIIDVDAIYAAISGREPHDLNLAQYAVATDLRERLYDIVRDEAGRWKDAWIISTAATEAEVKQLMERTKADRAVFIDATKDECLERAKERPAVFLRHIEQWFERVSDNAGVV